MNAVILGYFRQEIIRTALTKPEFRREQDGDNRKADYVTRYLSLPEPTSSNDSYTGIYVHCLIIKPVLPR